MQGDHCASLNLNGSEYFGAPKVSVCVVTYNQKDYIRRCLQSIVDQNVNFEFEVLVGDDCSTDGTRSVVLEFAERYPQIIRPILHEGNLGPSENYRVTHGAARGEYVAHIDGDDYALPGKLQSQADLLDSDYSCSMVAHRMEIVEGGRVTGATRECPEKIDLAWLLLKHPAFLNSSIMYRLACRGGLLADSKEFIDFYVYVHMLKSGKIRFINKILGGYVSLVGVSRSLNLMPFIQKAIDYAQISDISPALIRKARARQYRSYAMASVLKGEYSQGIYFSRQYYFNSPGLLSEFNLIVVSHAPGCLQVIIGAYRRVRAAMIRLGRH